MNEGMKNAVGIFRKVPYGDDRSIFERLYQALLMLMIGDKTVIVNATIRGTVELVGSGHLVVHTTIFVPTEPKLRISCE